MILPHTTVQNRAYALLVAGHVITFFNEERLPDRGTLHQPRGRPAPGARCRPSPSGPLRRAGRTIPARGCPDRLAGITPSQNRLAIREGGCRPIVLRITSGLD